jgi:4-hydroxy-tetrahydrodipicolinate synthase
MTLDLEGVYVPVVTPFDGDGEVDPATLTAVIARVLDAGAQGIVSCGTTGEYYALREAERIDVMRHTYEVATGRAQLVAGCNAGSTRMAIELARTAGDIGYDGLLLAAPPTSLPRAHELAAHFTAIAEASGLPTILYNYPARSGV